MFTSIKLYALLAVFFATAAASSYVTHRFDEAKLEKMELAYAQTQAVATAGLEDKREMIGMPTKPDGHVNVYGPPDAGGSMVQYSTCPGFSQVGE